MSGALKPVIERIAAGAGELGFEPIRGREQSTHLIGLRVGRGRAAELGGAFRASSVQVGIRGASIHVAPHMHTTDDDVSRLLACLATSR